MLCSLGLVYGEHLGCFMFIQMSLRTPLLSLALHGDTITLIEHIRLLKDVGADAPQ